MGWNDHMCSLEVECQNRGEVNDWEFWDDVCLAFIHRNCRHGSTRQMPALWIDPWCSRGYRGGGRFDRYCWGGRLQGAPKKRAVTDDLKQRRTARAEKIEALLAATPIRGKQEQFEHLIKLTDICGALRHGAVNATNHDGPALIEEKISDLAPKAARGTQRHGHERPSSALS
jgi:hypothetical protein